MITDSAGHVIKAIESDAYGEAIYDSNPGVTFPFESARGLKYADATLIRFGDRDYGLGTGRWSVVYARAQRRLLKDAVRSRYK